MKLPETVITVSLLALLALGTLPYAYGTSITVFSNNTDARDCYFNAKQVIGNPAQAQFLSESPCDRALDSATPFSRRDTIAIHINRGIIFTAHQEYQRAFQDYKTALELNPELPEAFANLGNLYFLDKNFNRAIEFYSKSLELGITQTWVVYINRGLVQEKLGNFERAESDYQQAKTIKPDWTTPEELLQRVQAKLKKQPAIH